MLQPNSITIISIFGGAGLALITWVIAACSVRKPIWSGDVLFGIVANSMTLCTIGCFLYNLCYFVWNKSSAIDAFQPTQAINIEGNETTAFFALAYAFYMICAGTVRNLISVCEKAKPKAIAIPVYENHPLT